MKNGEKDRARAIGSGGPRVERVAPRGVRRSVDTVARHAVIGGILFAKVQAARLIDESPEVERPDIVDPLGGRARIDDHQFAARIVVMGERVSLHAGGSGEGGRGFVFQGLGLHGCACPCVIREPGEIR